MTNSAAGGVGWTTRLVDVLGDKTAVELEKGLGLATVGDLLSHYPRQWVARGETSSTEDFLVGEQATLVAEVRAANVHPYRDRRTGRQAWRTEVKAQVSGEEVWMTFFDTRKWNSDSRLSVLRPGHRLLVSGKATRNGYRNNRWELTHPLFDTDTERELSPLQPVYRVTGKLASWDLERSVRLALDVVERVPDRVPEEMARRHRLVPADQALRWVHFPDDYAQLGAARKRLKFDEAFVLQVALARRRHQQRGLHSTARPGRPGGVLDAFADRMPFELTAGQRAVEAEIVADLTSARPMHRLLQGEVGSGKTVVALRAMLRVVDSGGQSALLAPTEVLAQQHHRSISRMLGDLAAGGMLGGAPEATRVTLLTGSMNAAARRAALLEIASGEAGIVVGTHALLEDVVQFADLGLVVVDEQHRFGVEQRAALGAKSAGGPPHVLVMTATPIPRTVAMTVFGDLETSVLRELPAGRAPIQTTVVPVAEQPAWVDRVWARVREEVAAGRQVYVVCPRISADGDRPVEDDADLLEDEPPDEEPAGAPPRPPLTAVEELAPRLAAGALQGLRVEALHGRMDPADKDAVMTRFAAGEVDVLVSTTVIEVGVDVGNATAMVVMDADRFGISQLHQLRGRVGRGGHPGLCLLVSHAPAQSGSRKRLDVVASTLDGFVLAEEDVRLRREGDVLGSSQSGKRRTFQMLSVLTDVDVIEEARAAAAVLVEEDPELGGAPDLRAEILRLESGERTDYLDKA